MVESEASPPPPHYFPSKRIGPHLHILNPLNPLAPPLYLPRLRRPSVARHAEWGDLPCESLAGKPGTRSMQPYLDKTNPCILLDWSYQQSTLWHYDGAFLRKGQARIERTRRYCNPSLFSSHNTCTEIWVQNKRPDIKLATSVISTGFD